MKNPKSDFKAGCGRDIPPPKAYVRIYFSQQGMAKEHADFFYQKCENTSWKNETGNPIKNWKTLACDWIWEHLRAEREKTKIFP